MAGHLFHPAMLAVGNTKPACQSPCVCASLPDNLQASAPYMGARRMKPTVLRRLYQGSALQQPAPQDTMTGKREENLYLQWHSDHQPIMLDSSTASRAANSSQHADHAVNSTCTPGNSATNLTVVGTAVACSTRSSFPVRTQ